MMIKMFRQGKSNATNICGYLMSEEKHEKYKPEILKGSIELTKSIVNSIHKNQTYKYTTGVISFAKDEIITEVEQMKLIKDFENTFAPFDKEERINFLWVRHFDKGRLELHFVNPRIDLKTEKMFTLHPPGKRNQFYYSLFCSVKNYEYGFKQIDKKYCSEENYNKKNSILYVMKKRKAVEIYNEFDVTKPRKIKKVNYGKRIKSNYVKLSKSTNSNSSDRKPFMFAGIGINGRTANANKFDEQQFTSNERLSKTNFENSEIRRDDEKRRDRGNSYDESTSSGVSGLEKIGVSMAEIDSQLGSLYLELMTSKNIASIQARIARLLAQRDNLLRQAESLRQNNLSKKIAP